MLVSRSDRSRSSVERASVTKRDIERDTRNLTITGHSEDGSGRAHAAHSLSSTRAEYLDQEKQQQKPRTPVNMRAAHILATALVVANARSKWRADRAMLPALATLPRYPTNHTQTHTPQQCTHTLAAQIAVWPDAAASRNKPHTRAQHTTARQRLTGGGYNCVMLVVLFRTRRAKRRGQVWKGQRKAVGVHYP